jgi:hypothetical protein
MKLTRLVASVCVLLSPAFVRLALGQDAMKNVHAAIAATALVVLPDEKGFASAFCIDSSGYFITNYHVVKDLAAGQHLTLVINAGEQNEKSVSASAVRVDQEDDLAVVKADGMLAFSSLQLGSVDELFETQPLTALGYPFGVALSLEKATRPSVSVNVAHVSSMRKSKGKLEFIQLDSQLNPGNSGGPVINDKGVVVGVVSSGVPGAGINFAVPVSKLMALLDRPELSFTPPVIAEEKIHDAVSLSIRAVPFGKPRPDMTLEIVLSTATGGERTYPAQSGTEKDVYTAHVIPVPARPANSLPAILTFTDGSIRCSVDDLTLRLDGKTYRLAQLTRVDFRSAGATITARDGSVISGAALSMPLLAARFGTFAIGLDATKATSLAISEPDKQTPNVSYRIVARSKGAVIGESKGMLVGTSDSAVASTDQPATAGETPQADANNTVAVGPGGPWINLGPRINVTRDTDVGEWTILGGALRNVEQRRVESSRLTIPVKPTGSYVFEFSFVRSENGKDLCALFPVGGRGAMIWIGSFDGQQSLLDGPGTKARGDLVRIMDGKPNKVEITVLNHGATSDIKMKLNGVDFLDWTGEPSQLQVNAGRATRDGRTLGFAICHHTVVQFTNIRVRALTGTIAPYVTGE